MLEPCSEYSDINPASEGLLGFLLGLLTRIQAKPTTTTLIISIVRVAFLSQGPVPPSPPSYLLPEKDVSQLKLLRQHHRLLIMDVVVCIPVNQIEEFVAKFLQLLRNEHGPSFVGCQVVLRSRQPHISLGVYGICQ